MLDSSNEEKIKIIKQCIYDCGYDIYYQKISGIYNYYFNPWQTYELVQKKLETYDIKIRNMFKLLLLGEPISEESAINSLGREFIENLLDVNFLINNNGILRSNGYSLVAYRERYFVASIPYDYPRCTGKQDIYIGLDSYKLADILPNRKIDRHLDLCSGTGIQSIMNAANFSEGYVVEKNKKVIPALKFNIILNGFNEKIKVINGDLFEKIRNEKFNLITANPPFIPIPNQFDFPMAGDGGEDGLKIINRIIEGLNEHLNNNGEAILIGEAIGNNQSTKLFSELKSKLPIGFKVDLFLQNRCTKEEYIERMAQFYIQKLCNNTENEKTLLNRWYKIFEKNNATHIFSFLLRITKKENIKSVFNEVKNYEEDLYILYPKVIKKYSCILSEPNYYLYVENKIIGTINDEIRRCLEMCNGEKTVNQILETTDIKDKNKELIRRAFSKICEELIKNGFMIDIGRTKE